MTDVILLGRGDVFNDLYMLLDFNVLLEQLSLEPLTALDDYHQGWNDQWALW